MKLIDILPYIRKGINDYPLDSSGNLLTAGVKYSDIDLLNLIASSIILKESVYSEGYALSDGLLAIDDATTVSPDVTDRYLYLLLDLIKQQLLPSYDKSVKAPDGSFISIKNANIMDLKSIISDYSTEVGATQDLLDSFQIVCTAEIDGMLD